MSFIEKLCLVSIAAILIGLILIFAYGISGGFQTKTDDGLRIIEWEEVTPPHQGLRCWCTGCLSNSVWGWCESQ